MARNIHSTKLTPINNVIRMHVFVDSSSVEVFANNGLVVLTDCIFSCAHNNGLELFTEGGQVVMNLLDVYQLNSAKLQVANNETQLLRDQIYNL